jgi:hypothetical protein
MLLMTERRGDMENHDPVRVAMSAVLREEQLAADERRQAELERVEAARARGPWLRAQHSEAAARHEASAASSSRNAELLRRVADEVAAQASRSSA